jgi:hypothetical protein
MGKLLKQLSRGGQNEERERERNQANTSHK